LRRLLLLLLLLERVAAWRIGTWGIAATLLLLRVSALLLWRIGGTGLLLLLAVEAWLLLTRRRRSAKLHAARLSHPALGIQRSDDHSSWHHHCASTAS
jgi:hypothetical protein